AGDGLMYQPHAANLLSPRTALAPEGAVSNSTVHMTNFIPTRGGLLVRRAAFLALVGLAGPGACGPFHRGTSASAAIIFKNESLDQADVYASGPDGNPVRIGTVFAGATDTLRVPA